MTEMKCLWLKETNPIDAACTEPTDQTDYWEVKPQGVYLNKSAEMSSTTKAATQYANIQWACPSTKTRKQGTKKTRRIKFTSSARVPNGCAAFQRAELSDVTQRVRGWSYTEHWERIGRRTRRGNGLLHVIIVLFYTCGLVVLDSDQFGLLLFGIVWTRQFGLEGFGIIVRDNP